MRFRPWLMLAGLAAILVLTAPPAAAQGTGFDQVKIISDMAKKLPEPANRPRQWLDLGMAHPVGTFEDRGWDPGFLARWSQEVWASGGASIVGSLGLAFNDRSRFNEAQIDAAYDYGFAEAGDTIAVVGRHHVGVPFACELQLEPLREQNFSPFFAAGPAVQFTSETLVREKYYGVVYPDFVPFVVPISTYTPSSPALVADRRVTKTHFHLGYQARAGLRAAVGPASSPIHMRLTVSLNTWFEHDRPVTVGGATISFGR